MFRSGARATLRFSNSSLAPLRTAAPTGRRLITTAPPHVASRSWKNSALRWGLAAAGIYYYNTSPLFAEYPQSNLLNPNVEALDEAVENSTLDQLTASSRNKAKKDPSILQSAIEQTSEEDAAHRQENIQSTGASAVQGTPEGAVTDGAAELEQEAEGEGAFNPVTGEINWDCPCLGGMAYGPCGPEFREAFSCFVYSKEDPKGMDCIDKFQNMQTCFRAHPEHYKGELEDDDAIDAELALEKEELQKEIEERRGQFEAQQQRQRSSKQSLPDSNADPQPEAKVTSHTPSAYSASKEADHGAPSRIVGQPAATKVPQDAQPERDAQPETESIVRKASYDATDATAGDSRTSAQ